MIRLPARGLADLDFLRSLLRTYFIVIESLEHLVNWGAQ